MREEIVLMMVVLNAYGSAENSSLYLRIQNVLRQLFFFATMSDELPLIVTMGGLYQEMAGIYQHKTNYQTYLGYCREKLQ